MAIKKISELPALSGDMATNDLLVIVDASETTQTNKTKRANANQIRVFNSSQLNNGVVSEAAIASGAVTNAKISNGAVEVSKIDGLYGMSWQVGNLIYMNDSGQLSYLKHDYPIVNNKIVDKSIVSFIIYEEIEPLEPGQKKLLWVVPPNFDGYTINEAVINVMTASTSGLVRIDVRRGRRSSATTAPTYYSIFSTQPSIDVGEFSSRNAATAPVIRSPYSTVNADDVLSFDVTLAGTNAKYLCVSLEFSK